MDNNDFLKDVYQDLLPTPDQIAGGSNADQNPTTATTVDTNASPEQGVEKVEVSGVESKTEAKPEGSTPEDVSWDSFIPESTAPATESKTQIDWSEVGKAINISEVKGQEDVVKYVSELKKTVEDLKSKQIGDNVPKELAEAIDLAKNGGDYRTYLEVSSVDYSQEHPEDLFEDEVAELFYNADGSFREDEFVEYIDSIPLPDKKMRGLQIQRELVAMQEQQKNMIRQKASMEKAENLRKLERSLDGFNIVDTFDVTPKMKKQLFNELATGQFLNELGISEGGSHNWEKLLNTYFKAKYFDTVQKFNSRESVKQHIRADLNGLNNSNVGKPSKPENPTETVKRSGADLYLNNIK